MKQLLLLLFAGSTAGLSAAPSWSGTLAPSKPGPHPAVTPRKLEYRVSWKAKMDAGRITLDFAPSGISKPGSLVVSGSAASTGTAAVLFSYSTSLWSEIHPSTLRPRFFRSIEKSGGETETITNRFAGSSITSERHTVPAKGPATTHKNTFPHPSFDLASAILFVRSQPLAAGNRLRLLVHPYHTPYLVDLKVTGRETKDGKPAIRLDATLRKLDRKTSEPAAYKKLKGSATIWISDDADRVPLELRAPVFIGDIRAILVAHTPHR